MNSDTDWEKVSDHDGDYHADSGIRAEVWDVEADNPPKQGRQVRIQAAWQCTGRGSSLCGGASYY